jgi:hypothetical protein
MNVLLNPTQLFLGYVFKEEKLILISLFLIFIFSKHLNEPTGYKTIPCFNRRGIKP